MMKKLKGSILIAQSAEGFASVLMMLALTFIFAGYSRNDKLQTIKVMCYNANVSAIEKIKKEFYESGDIIAVSEFTSHNGENGELKTTVSECVVIIPGSGVSAETSSGSVIYDGALAPYNADLISIDDTESIFFITVDTEYLGRKYAGTSLSVYLMPKSAAIAA